MSGNGCPLKHGKFLFLEIRHQHQAGAWVMANGSFAAAITACG